MGYTRGARNWRYFVLLISLAQRTDVVVPAAFKRTSEESYSLANSKSALKHIKTSERERLRNRAAKSAARTFVKQARTSIQGNSDEAAARVEAAISALDRAARKGVIHRNNAARRKSRLVKLLRQQTA